MSSPLKLSSLVSCSSLLALAISTASAQTVQPVLSAGDPFLDFTVVDFHDIAIGDDGEWFAAVTTSPQLGTPLSVIYSAGTEGRFTPGAVANLPGTTATLVNEVVLADYWQTGTTVTISSPAPHGQLAGGQLRLNFIGPGTLTDGIFTVQTVPDPFTFTVTYGTSGTCGSALAPCGQVQLDRTIQAVDLNYSLGCGPVFQGVLQMADDTDPGTPPVIVSTSNDTGVFWDSTVLRREGDVSIAPQVAPGTTYTRIWRTVVDSRGDYFVLARMNDPTVADTEVALVKLGLTASCPPALAAEQVLVRTGNSIQNAGNVRFEAFHSLEKHGFAVNARGDFMYVAALEQASGLPSAQSAVVVNNRAVLRDFTMVPDGQGQIVGLPLAAVDLNDLGDYVIQVVLQEGLPVLCDNQPPGPIQAWCVPYGEAIVRGHASGGANTKLVQTGDPLPDASLGMPGEIMLKVGRKLEHNNALGSFPALLTNGGDLIWYGEWGHLDANDDEVQVGAGIFFNQKLIVQAGQELSGPDDVLLSIGLDPLELRSAMVVSPDGRYLLFTGRRGEPGGASPVSALFRVDLGASVPYGTVAQGDGTPGCTYPYPVATLDCAPGRALPGSSALADFPLVGHDLQVVARSAPAGATVALFAFTASAPTSFPCGFGVPGFPFEILLGPTRLSTRLVGVAGGSALYSQPIPPTVLGLVGTDWYGQAFFLSSSAATVGATNAVRFVLGAP
jgi:hypothetical protein